MRETDDLGNGMRNNIWTKCRTWGVKVPRVVRANRDLIVKIYANHGPFNNYAITWGTQ
jgi:hypothetical protein